MDLKIQKTCKKLLRRLKSLDPEELEQEILIQKWQRPYLDKWIPLLATLYLIGKDLKDKKVTKELISNPPPVDIDTILKDEYLSGLSTFEKYIVYNLAWEGAQGTANTLGIPLYKIKSIRKKIREYYRSC